VDKEAYNDSKDTINKDDDVSINFEITEKKG